MHCLVVEKCEFVNTANRNQLPYLFCSTGPLPWYHSECIAEAFQIIPIQVVVEKVLLYLIHLGGGLLEKPLHTYCLRLGSNLTMALSRRLNHGVWFFQFLWSSERTLLFIVHSYLNNFFFMLPFSCITSFLEDIFQEYPLDILHLLLWHWYTVQYEHTVTPISQHSQSWYTVHSIY